MTVVKRILIRASVGLIRTVFAVWAMPACAQTADAPSDPQWMYWLVFIGLGIYFVGDRVLRSYSTGEKETGEREDDDTASRLLVVIRTYRGSQDHCLALFRRDAVSMAAAGYVPSIQTWTPGQWGLGQFLFALVLCFVLVGFVVFIYMLIVKPPGSLNVVYRLEASHETR